MFLNMAVVSDQDVLPVMADSVVSVGSPWAESVFQVATNRLKMVLGSLSCSCWRCLDWTMRGMKKVCWMQCGVSGDRADGIYFSRTLWALSVWCPRLERLRVRTPTLSCRSLVRFRLCSVLSSGRSASPSTPCTQCTWWEVIALMSSELWVSFLRKALLENLMEMYLPVILQVVTHAGQAL